MRDPRHPRHFTDEFKRQIVDLHNAGKPKRGIMDEHDLGKSTVERRVESINATGSPRRTPAALAVVAAHAASKGRYGPRKIKASPGRPGATASRRRACRIMGENGPVGAYGGKRFKARPGAVNEADVPNAVARGFGGRAPRTHICGALACVRVGASRNCARP